MSSKQPKTIIILGMHRSGTSMVAGVLHNLGINMGDACIGASVNNPYGHFEDINLIALNQRILQAADADWKNPPSAKKILRLKGRFDNQIRKLLKNVKAGDRGWKDPRTSLTIPLFLPHLKNPYFIVCRRRKKAVNKSLQKRSLLEIDGKKLWKKYNQRIDKFFKKHSDLKKIEVEYEKFVRQPQQNIDEIISFLEISPTKQQISRARANIISPQQKRSLVYRLRAVPEFPKLAVSWLQLVLAFLKSR